MSKTYVKVIAEYSETGKVTPLSITWTDGRAFQIDRVLDARPISSLKKGAGEGIRFTCRIRVKEFYLFCDESGRWYIEQ